MPEQKQEQKTQETEVSVLDDLLEGQEEQKDTTVEGEEGQQAAGASEGEVKKDIDPLDDLLATLNDAAGQQIDAGGTQQIQPQPQPQQQQVIQPAQQQQQSYAQYQPPVIEKPTFQISQADYDDAVASPAGLQRFADKIVSTVLNAVQKPLTDGISGAANFALQNALTKTVETVSPIIDHKVNIRGTISEWWADNKDLIKARNLVGAAANRIAAKNPNISLEKLLQESGNEVRKLIKNLQTKSTSQGKPKASSASLNGTRQSGTQGSNKRKDSIMAQLGIPS